MTKNSSLPINPLLEQLPLTIHPSLRSPFTESIAQLKDAVLSAQTLGELYALMEDYSYRDFMQVYKQLTPKQQAAIHAICDRDTQLQIAALNTAKIPKNEVGKGKRLDRESISPITNY